MQYGPRLCIFEITYEYDHAPEFYFVSKDERFSYGNRNRTRFEYHFDLRTQSLHLGSVLSVPFRFAQTNVEDACQPERRIPAEDRLVTMGKNKKNGI